MKHITRTTKNIITISLLLVFLSVAGSFGVGCHKSVERVEVDSTRDLSGRWNDTDSRLVSDEMIKDATAQPWITRFTQSHQRKPVVIVGRVANKSEEHINTETFVKDLERALIREDKVSFVASSDEREGVRAEREDMSRNAESSTQKIPGQESGADYIIIGQINTIFDTESKERIGFYQVELEAVDMRNNQKVWIGQKKLKKYIKSPNKKF